MLGDASLAILFPDRDSVRRVQRRRVEFQLPAQQQLDSLSRPFYKPGPYMDAFFRVPSGCSIPDLSFHTSRQDGWMVSRELLGLGDGPQVSSQT